MKGSLRYIVKRKKTSALKPISKVIVCYHFYKAKGLGGKIYMVALYIKYH